MIGTRIAVGLLTTAVTALVVGCAPAAEPQPDTPAANPQADTAAPHPSETLAPLFEQALPNVPGKTFTSAIVAFPPAAHAVPHRHGDAFVYAYVLEGTVSSQSKASPRTCTTRARTGPNSQAPTTWPPRTPARPNRRNCWSSSSPPPENSSRSMIRTGKLPVRWP